MAIILIKFYATYRITTALLHVARKINIVYVNYCKSTFSLFYFNIIDKKIANPSRNKSLKF